MIPHVTYRTKSNILILLCVVFSFASFSQHKLINSGWQFSEDKTNWETVNIPHTWNLLDAFDDEKGYRRGFGYYKKKVFTPSEERDRVHYLKFNAVNQEATVLVNGKKVGGHKGGYTAFNFDISNFIKFDAYNLIEVEVDNSHNIDIPPLDADFTFYGGIYRDVELISLPKQHFSLDDFASDGFYVHYKRISNEKGDIDVDVVLSNKDTEKSKVNLKVQLLNANDEIVESFSKRIKLNSLSSEKISIDFPEIINPKLWSPDNPYLYQLKLELTDKNENILDSKTANVGFRWASVDPQKGFFLNGKSIKLIGVNRHQDYQGYGNAVPLHLQEKDIAIIKNMGANVIRFAHYPHRRELYDLCDELGLLVWTEIPIINKVTDSKAFFDVSINMQKEHLKQYYNHPSVVMFGYMNEIFLRLAFDRKSSAEEKENIKSCSLKLAQQLEDLTRQLAPNHITVMACHLNELYNETGIADLPMLLGWNLYFGWYDKDIPDLGPFLDDQHKRFPKRSLLLSEYGPGADVRIFTKTPKKFDFSTDYQAKLHQSYYQQITERPFMAGMTAWNFADFGSEFRGDAIPHVNQKGLVQYDRTPKEIYHWYKSVLDKDEPFIHIASGFLKGLTLFKDETYPVQVFSNQSNATVFLNDKKLKNVQFNNGSVTIDMLFENKTNTVKVVSENISEEKTIDIIKIEKLDFKDFNRFGINIGSHFYFNDYERNLTFIPDQSYKNGLFGYLDGAPFNLRKENHQGVPYNIKYTTSDPLFQTMLQGCTSYKVDVPNGNYKVSLFFVEPLIKPVENIYNLTKVERASPEKQRIFDLYLNDVVLEKQFDMAKTYPEKYGITKIGFISIKNNEGLKINLKPIKGKPVISGILIEKLN